LNVLVLIAAVPSEKLAICEKVEPLHFANVVLPDWAGLGRPCAEEGVALSKSKCLGTMMSLEILLVGIWGLGSSPRDEAAPVDILSYVEFGDRCANLKPSADLEVLCKKSTF
jgi:hypothetical protein